MISHDTVLDARVCLVIGGWGGIGAATVNVLRAAGGVIALAGPEIGPLAAGTFGYRVDVTSEKSVEELLSAVVKEHGRVDAVVNSAGIISKSDFLDLSTSEWARVLQTNLTGTFHVIRAAARRMVEAGRGGSIVNVSSVMGVFGHPFAAHYAASKGGIDALTRSAAVALASQAVRVNAVAPGTTETPLNARRRSDPRRSALALDRMPMGRYAEPSEIAEVIAFLASDRASYITGQVLAVDGGWEAQPYSRSFDDLQRAAESERELD